LKFASIFKNVFKLDLLNLFNSIFTQIFGAQNWFAQNTKVFFSENYFFKYFYYVKIRLLRLSTPLVEENRGVSDKKRQSGKIGGADKKGNQRKSASDRGSVSLALKFFAEIATLPEIDNFKMFS